MNRDDLLKKCIDRGVADEASVEAVSHLFYMYLLTALQKGQRVEVPDFGTFGTRVVGVKHLRRMPYFEAERELADKVNDRYRDLKYLIVGRYELTPSAGQEEYAGREAPYDDTVEEVGKEMLLDTHRDVTIEEYERSLALARGATEAKEKAMPKLNLKEETPGEELRELEEAAEPPPSLEEEEPAQRGPSALVQVFVAVGLLALITFSLNHFGVVRLWGPSEPQVAEPLPPPAEVAPPVAEAPPQEVPPAQPAEPGAQPAPAQPGVVTPTPTPTPTPAAPPEQARQKPPAPVQKPASPPAEPKPLPSKPPAGVKPSMPPSIPGGAWTVQVSSWATRSKARVQAERLTAAGYDSFVSRAVVNGRTWHRVRVGRYATEGEAVAALVELRKVIENGLWVDTEQSR